jgi:tetratricopeptide (TPR) repeat protein/tRNA A-37 threonylcarbamoyl transferase component Bud32
LARDANHDEAVGLRRAAEDGAFADVGVEQEVVRARVHEALFQEHAPPVRVGRYIVTQKVGSGGMGVVYAAYDPALDRKVALKVLRPSADVEQRRQRLVREARALAKLSHPHVVVVHDVGTVGEDASASVFIAMEFVDGATLGRWIADQAPPWRTRLEVLVQAGRGLSAAHAVGLVHRDLKPDNVMVSREGSRGDWRARVMDFGLVHPLVTRATTDSDVGQLRGSEATSPGKLAGTLAYMAPEQLQALPTDARTDQFGFCVTLWEALHGERPFEGATRSELVEAVLRGTPRPPANTAVPAWVQRALLRGLRPVPDERFASMDDLLAALGDDPTRRRVRWAVALGGVGAIAGAFGVNAWIDARARDECTRSGEDIAGVWNEARRDALEAAFGDSGLSYAADTWTRVEPRLDDYAARWAELRTSNCMAALTRERSPDLVERSEACLQEHRLDFAATIDALDLADAFAIQNAVQAVLELPDVERCDELGWLAEQSPPAADPELRAEIEALRRELARAAGLVARHSTEALASSASVHERALELDAAPLRLDAQLAMAAAHQSGGDAARAVEVYREGFTLAVELGDDDLAARSSTALVFLLGNELNLPAEAEVWAEVAEAFLARSDVEAGAPTAWLLNARGAIARQQGRYHDAQRDFAEAAATFERALGLDHTRTIQAVANLAVVQWDLGDYISAENTMRRVTEARMRLLGPEHPEVALALVSHAAALGGLGRFADGLALLQQALAIEEQAFGANHPRVAMTLLNIGHIQTVLGDLPAALATQRRQLAIREAENEPSRLGKALVAVGLAHVSLFEYNEAMPLLVRACELLESSLGPTHAELALCLEVTAEAHVGFGQVAEELPLRQRVLEIREAALGTSHPDTAIARSDLGAAQLRAGDTDAALPTLRLALFELSSSVGVEHQNTAIALRRIGQVYHQRGELETALQLLRSAMALEERAGMASDLRNALSHHLVGRVLVDLNRPGEAVREHELAVELVEKKLGADHRFTAELMIGRAEAERGIDRLDDAEAHARHALAILQRDAINPSLTAEAELVLGEILLAGGRKIEGREHIANACAAAPPPSALRLRRCR